RRDQDAAGRGGEDDSGLDRVVAADLLEVHGDDERCAEQQEPLDVLRHKRKVARSVPEEPRRKQRLLTGPLLATDEEEEREQEHRSEREERHRQRVPRAELKNPYYDEEHADRREDGADGIERT